MLLQTLNIKQSSWHRACVAEQLFYPVKAQWVPMLGKRIVSAGQCDLFHHWQACNFFLPICTLAGQAWRRIHFKRGTAASSDAFRGLISHSIGITSHLQLLNHPSS